MQQSIKTAPLESSCERSRADPRDGCVFKSRDASGDRSPDMEDTLSELEDLAAELVEEESEHLSFEDTVGESSARRVSSVPLARRVHGTAPRSSLRAMSKETIRL
eukprot:6194789-Pleurochrysis_carterae.AAC.3